MWAGAPSQPAAVARRVAVAGPALSAMAGRARHGQDRTPAAAALRPPLPGAALLEPLPNVPWRCPASSDECPPIDDICHRDWCSALVLGRCAGDCPLLYIPHAPLAARGCSLLGEDPKQ